MKKKLKILQKTLYWGLIIILVVIASLATLSAFNIPGGVRLYTVQSGSMEPAIRTGSVVFVRPSLEYKEGDIITFKNEADRNEQNPAATTTHRVHQVVQEEGMISFITKGDANDSPDGSRTDAGLILGKTFLTIPLLGYLVSFVKTQLGLTLLIIIPATLIVYGEVLNIKKEAKRLIEERKRRKLTSREKVVTLVGEPISVEEGYKNLFKAKSKKVDKKKKG
jgi:signal peptidase I